jgi:16S rRNA (cytosine967-C5)-methyltransferase
MRPAARLQAAIDILDAVLHAVRSNGPAADVLLARYFSTRRYAGAKDRAAVRQIVFDLLRKCPDDYAGSARVLAAAHGDTGLFGVAEPHAPQALEAMELSAAQDVRAQAPLSRFPDLPPQLLERAPLDVRVNTLKATRETALLALGGAPCPYAPWGIRLPTGTAVEKHPLFQAGGIDIQDEGSQLVALATAAQPGETVIDLCAGAGGKSLALAAMMQNQGRLIASDIDMRRLERLYPRAARAGATMETLPLDRLPQADCVLVDAPCTGTGTWRRNPEARLRLRSEAMARTLAAQRDVLDRAVSCTTPGGRIIYAVCSLLPEEGQAQIDALLARARGMSQTPVATLGAPFNQLAETTPGLVLTPQTHGCDGFFIACLHKAC